jgi:hypothetical protein
LDPPSAAGLGASGCFSVFSGVFVVEEFDGVGGKGSGYTTTVDVQTLMEAFVSMSLRSACSVDEAFSW